MHLPPLFALDPEWFRLAVFLVVAVGYVISFVTSRLRDKQVAKTRQPAAPRRDPNTAKELEEFLKRSSASRPDATAKRPAPAPRAPVATERRPRGTRRKSEEREKRRPAPAATIPAQKSTPASLVNLRESDLTKDRAAEPLGHVVPSIDTRDISERASHLGNLESASPLQDHLKQTFSHRVGTLTAAPTDNLAAQNRAAAAAAAATGTKQTLPVAALLSGGNLRNAIILNEILQRPEERW
jgi:hypothetical protein